MMVNVAAISERRGVIRDQAGGPSARWRRSVYVVDQGGWNGDRADDARLGDDPLRVGSVGDAVGDDAADGLIAPDEVLGKWQEGCRGEADRWGGASSAGDAGAWCSA